MNFTAIYEKQLLKFYWVLWVEAKEMREERNWREIQELNKSQEAQNIVPTHWERCKKDKKRDGDHECQQRRWDVVRERKTAEGWVPGKKRVSLLSHLFIRDWPTGPRPDVSRSMQNWQLMMTQVQHQTLQSHRVCAINIKKMCAARIRLVILKRRKPKTSTGFRHCPGLGLNSEPRPLWSKRYDNKKKKTTDWDASQSLWSRKNKIKIK